MLAFRIGLHGQTERRYGAVRDVFGKSAQSIGKLSTCGVHFAVTEFVLVAEGDEMPIMPS